MQNCEKTCIIQFVDILSAKYLENLNLGEVIKTMKKSNWLLLVFGLVLTLFLAACSGGDDSDSSSEGSDSEGNAEESSAEQVLNLIEVDEIPSMDPSMATDAIAFQWLGATMEGLYRLGENGEVKPGIATDHEVSEDSLTWTFNLREDATWSNGDPVTAHDFVYSWRRAVDPDTGSSYGPYMMGGVIKNATAINQGEMDVEELGVKAEDDYTLVVELENPTPYFESLATFGTYLPLNQAFVEEQGDQFALEADTILYNGPFTMTEWNHNQNFVIEKNPNYWDADSVDLEKINLDIVKDTSTAVNMYETGEIDRVGLSAEYVDQYAGDERMRVIEEPTLFYLKMNQTRSEALANLNVRKAIQLAIDKQGYTDVILNNGSVVAGGLVPANFVNHPETGEDFREINGDLVPVVDKEKAKEYWNKALEELGTDSVEIEMLGDDGESAEKTAEYFQEQLQSTLPGLTIKIKSVPFQERIRLNEEMDYDLQVSGWGPDYIDPLTFMNLFVTDGPNNNMGYSNEKYDELIASTSGELAQDPAARWDAFLEAEKILIQEDAAISPLYQRARTQLWDQDIQGVIVNPAGPQYEYKWAHIE